MVNNSGVLLTTRLAFAYCVLNVTATKKLAYVVVCIDPHHHKF